MSKNLTLFLLLTLSCFTIWRVSPPEIESHEQERGYSLKNINSHLQEITRFPHPIGTTEHQKVKNYIITELQKLGLKAEVQKTYSATQVFSNIDSAFVENILVRIPGSNSSKAIMLSAHYDTTPHSLGAADDGAAVAAMLEMARVFSKEVRLKNDLILFFSDAEEHGLNGAYAFIRDHIYVKDVGVILNFEARGTSGPSAMFETSDQNGLLIEAFANSASYPITNSLVGTLAKILPNSTDMELFKKFDMNGLNFAFADDLQFYHTLKDNFTSLDQRSLNHHASYAFLVTRHLGLLDLNNIKSNNKIYFDIFGLIIVHYSYWVSYILSALLFLILIIGWRGLKQQDNFSLRNTLIHLTFNLFSFLSILASIFYVSSLANQNNSYSLIWQYNKLFISIYFLFAFSLYNFLFALFTNKNNFFLSWWTGLSCWSLFAIVLGIAFPSAGYIFQIPLLLPYLLCTYHIRTESKETPSGSILFLVLLPAVTLLSKMIYVTNILDGGLTPLISILFALLLFSILKALFFNYSKLFWVFISLSLLIASLISLTIAVEYLENDSANPNRYWLNYVLDGETKQAHYMTSSHMLPCWMKPYFLNESTAINGFSPEYYKRRVSAAPALKTPLPEIRLLNDSQKDGVRTLSLEVSSPRGARCFTLWEDTLKNIEVRIAGKDVYKMYRFSKKTDNKLADLLGYRRGKTLKIYHCGLQKNEKLSIQLSFPKSENRKSLNFNLVDESIGLPSAPEFKQIYVPQTYIPHTFSDMTLVKSSLVVH